MNILKRRVGGCKKNHLRDNYAQFKKYICYKNNIFMERLAFDGQN